METETPLKIIGKEKLGEIWGFKTVGIAKTDEEMQSWIAQHDQSKLPNVGNNIWKAGDIMYANLDDNPAIEKVRLPLIRKI